eukprot:CAMPEP_0169134764 /NCGR_PEP_ID=MMETSP1015-20121227/40069_1 /TAXON_ID=342587 /ORGANISM="Karlodinium micrum, Strain CCMP2283" /LENGTH=32 /DNA_ID= /DNA_START= /DNA_END= /DNA_ORIENTATION=
MAETSKMLRIVEITPLLSPPARLSKRSSSDED